MVKAVLFDLFETLITETGSHPTRASSLGETLGLEREAFRATWKTRRPRIVLGQLSFGEALAEISQKLKGGVDPAAVERVHEQRVREKTALFTSADLRIARMVTGLRGLGVSLAVVSNCFAEDIQAWNLWPLAVHFQFNVFSCEVGLAKPDPEIYRTATRSLNVDPNSCVFIGDGGDDELQGAERAGIRSFRAGWFITDPPQGERAVSSHITLADCDDVLRLVA